MELVVPDEKYLPGFADALRRGWSPSTESDVTGELLAEIEADPAAFLRGADDRDPQGRTVTLPDGSVVPRLPGFARWMWDGELCGSINMRWQPGTAALPPHVLGHIGYSVVPWKRRRGYATEALRAMLDEVRELGLPYVELTTDLENEPSQQVIRTNGGTVVREVDKGPWYGHGRALLWRVAVAPAS